MAINDTKKSKLNELGYSNPVQQMERDFYAAATGLNTDFHTMMNSWLALQGFSTGTLPDRWKAYLNSLGYTGSLAEMLLAFWDNYSTGGTFRILTEDSNNLITEDSNFLRT